MDPPGMCGVLTQPPRGFRPQPHQQGVEKGTSRPRAGEAWHPWDCRSCAPGGPVGTGGTLRMRGAALLRRLMDKPQPPQVSQVQEGA